MKRNFIRKQGFTLIELLVVIAIIGILAALVLVALGNARDKANDSRIKSDVGQLRTLAEVYYDANSASYSGFNTCYSAGTGCQGNVGSSVTSLKNDLQSAGATTINVNSAASTFCISANLKSTSATHVCVDATGAFKETTTSNCGASNQTCP